ncbi:MAG: sensor histidine kinase [Spirochaetales bacterium]|nr:sensor histidine kinase [Spirochaetales bacterium]
MVLILAVMVSGCGEEPEGGRPAAYLPVSSLSRRWLEIKTDLLEGGGAPFNTVDLRTRLEDFTGALDRFSASPAGSLYQIQQPRIAEPVTAIGESAERLLPAALAGDEAAVFAGVLEIDRALDQLQSIDTGISNTIQLRYFQLFFFFTLLVIITILAVWLLNRRLRNAVSRERQSLIFSRETALAQEQERSRLARELHDTVAQDLWRLSFQTDRIGGAAGEEERRLLCREVVEGQRELIKRVRAICNTLIPPDFQRQGLAGALRGLCYNFRQRTGIECALTVQEGLELDPLGAEAQLQCFRVVQECLMNIEKHARAREAAVLVSNGGRGKGRGEPGGPAVLRINVSDNGRGFPVPDGDSRLRLRTAGHLGLWTMYERAAALGGTLAIDSEEGEGAHITLEVPLVQNPAGG